MESPRLRISFRMKRKKIYYVPGLISLLGLSIICVLIVIKGSQPRPHDQRPYRLLIPSPNKLPNLSFSENAFLQNIKRKKTFEVDLDELDTLKRSFIKRKIEDLQYLHDTTAIVKVNFLDSNTFGDFMWLLTQMHTYKVKRYAFFNNTFYILGNEPPAPPGPSPEPLYM